MLREGIHPHKCIYLSHREANDGKGGLLIVAKWIELFPPHFKLNEVLNRGDVTHPFPSRYLLFASSIRRMSRTAVSIATSSDLSA